MKEITEADSMGLGTTQNVRGGSAEPPSGACCGGGAGEEENAACLGQGGAAAVIATMRDGEATTKGNQGGSGSARCVEMTDEEMGPTGRPPVGDDLDDEEQKVVKNKRSLAPPTATGQHKGMTATSLGGSGLGEVGLESFTALVPMEEEDVGHSDGGRYVRVCD